LVIEDPDSPYKGKYDGEYVLTVSDWYHGQMPALLQSFLTYTNPTGAEPVPDSAIMNDMQNPTFLVEPGKTYLFRIINMGAFAGQYLWFQGHQMRVVEVDGVWTEEAETEMLYMSVAQRYSVLVTMQNETSANHPIVSSMDQVRSINKPGPPRSMGSELTRPGRLCLTQSPPH
jgi:iron transport multicopper oxidase